MTQIDTAVLLAAGAGTRLRDAAESKPLCEVAGKPLIDHAIERLARSGISRVIVTTGYRAEAIEAHLAGRDWPVVVQTARTIDWRQPNGVSALAAAPLLDGRDTLLAMCDHLVEPALYARLAAAGAGDGLRLGIDRRLGHPWVDPLDVTFVATDGDRITAIGKEMTPHDCYDTGVFAVGSAFFEALSQLAAPSITEAVRSLIDRNTALTVDCSDLDWIDVDDPKALQAANEWAGAVAG
ncbi:phosphocholine cytidylyltransferase family protein [Sphingomonas aliaeris]|uniref:phosphocholine cytidylyltransferase family protein n=1 Tax=Sphingomonas aliaeris TaxID=2759526 RepID=UPI001CEDA7A4|nr:NTP transferase domain-containing protein [Sphingomonas aliaeris]